MKYLTTITWLVLALAGCGSDEPSSDPASDDAGAVADADLDAPAHAEALVPFLKAKKYATWQSEPDYHESSGPHGDAVRVFYGPRAAAALEQGMDTFPAGAATVKELTSDGELYGWAVWTKVRDDSAEGDGFYWYERIEDGDDVTVYGDGRGHSDCVDCHAPGKDFLLSSGSFE